ncbi:MAG: GNAT family N-acetyltransferase [Oscillospiraceae bacterium]|nr:GNAT family N-acetyltransferase [Oscillospiraceae bacterium]
MPKSTKSLSGKNISIRELSKNETGILRDFLYEAIFIPVGVAPPPRDIVDSAELRVYTDNFGQEAGDFALVAEVDGYVVGAVWVRIMNDYGHVDDDTPSLAISLYKGYRGLGLGTKLMCGILELLRQNGYRKVSLAVQKANYALSLYQKTGFKIIGEHGEEYIMVCDL